MFILNEYQEEMLKEIVELQKELESMENEEYKPKNDASPRTKQLLQQLKAERDRLAKLPESELMQQLNETQYLKEMKICEQLSKHYQLNENDNPNEKPSTSSEDNQMNCMQTDSDSCELFENIELPELDVGELQKISSVDNKFEQLFGEQLTETAPMFSANAVKSSKTFPDLNEYIKLLRDSANDFSTNKLNFLFDRFKAKSAIGADKKPKESIATDSGKILDTKLKNVATDSEKIIQIECDSESNCSGDKRKNCNTSQSTNVKRSKLESVFNRTHQLDSQHKTDIDKTEQVSGKNNPNINDEFNNVLKEVESNYDFDSTQLEFESLFDTNDQITQPEIHLDESANIDSDMFDKFQRMDLSTTEKDESTLVHDRLVSLCYVATDTIRCVSYRTQTLYATLQSTAIEMTTEQIKNEVSEIETLLSMLHNMHKMITNNAEIALKQSVDTEFMHFVSNENQYIMTMINSEQQLLAEIQVLLQKRGL